MDSGSGPKIQLLDGRILSETSLAWTRHRRDQTRCWKGAVRHFVHCTTGFLLAKFEPINFNQRLCCRAQRRLGLLEICEGLLIDKVKSLDHIRHQSCGFLQFTYRADICTGFGQVAIRVCRKLIFCKNSAKLPVFLELPIFWWTLKAKQLMPNCTI